MRFNEQPCAITYALDGQLRCHYPDILVETKGRKELWEVKSEARAKELEIATRTKLLIEELPRWGYTYLVVLAKDLAIEPRLANAGFLLRFGRSAVSNCEREFIRQTVKRYGSLRWSDASSGKYGPELGSRFFANRSQGCADHGSELADFIEHSLYCQEGERLNWEPPAWNKTRLWRLTVGGIVFTVRSPTPAGSWRNRRRGCLLRKNTMNCFAWWLSSN